MTDMSAQSFADFLEAYGKAYRPAMTAPPGGGFAAWREAFIRQVRTLLGNVPPRVKLAVRTVDTVRGEGHVRHDLRIAVSDLTVLPAYLLVPDDLADGQRRPAIVALHGHTTFGRQTIVGMDNKHTRSEPTLAYGLDAVRAGYVVMAPAWWGFPGRDGHQADIAQGRDPCNVIQMAASMYGLNVLALHMQDAHAAIDALVQRPEVDPARIGCMGNSYGGRTAMWLSMLDERIAATVASGCMNTFRERSVSLRSCAVQCPPGLLRYGDVAEVFSAIAPRPLQLMTGRADKLMNDADVAAIQRTVRSAYRVADAESQFDFADHPGGHCLVWDLARPFLDKHLGGMHA